MITEALAKDARIKKEISRLKRLFKKLPNPAMITALSLVNNAAFITITLEDLQSSINTSGLVSQYKNGENQFGTKKSPEIEVYNSMLKNLRGIIKQLTDLLPKPEPEPVIPLKTEAEKNKDEFNRILRREGNGTKTN